MPKVKLIPTQGKWLAQDSQCPPHRPIFRDVLNVQGDALGCSTMFYHWKSLWVALCTQAQPFHQCLASLLPLQRSLSSSSTDRAWAIHRGAVFPALPCRWEVQSRRASGTWGGQGTTASALYVGTHRHKYTINHEYTRELEHACPGQTCTVSNTCVWIQHSTHT